MPNTRPTFVQRAFNRNPRLQKRSVATGPMPMSQHQPRAHAKAGTRLHGFFRRLTGTISGNKAKKASGTRMMHGNNLTHTRGASRKRKLGF